jgi:hypothetical protein
MKTSLAVAALAAVALSAGRARAERPRIAVMEMDAPKVAADLRERMTHAVHEGLIASGADVVDGIPEAATGPGGVPCQGNGCVTAVAEATLAAYVVRGTLEVEGRTYELRLEMLDGKAGGLLDSREDRCEICTEGEALEMAGVSASALKVQVFKKKAVAWAGATGTTSVVAPSVTPPSAAPPPASVVSAPTTPPSAPVSRLGIKPADSKRVGLTIVTAGVLAALGGSTLISFDGKGTCNDGPNQCPNVYATEGWGIGVFALGAAAVAAGILVLAGKL